MTHKSDLTYSKLPERYREGMRRYIENRIPPFGLIKGILENDLWRTLVSRETNDMHEIVNIFSWIYNEVPSMCWGSPEKVRAWIEKGEEMNIPEERKKCIPCLGTGRMFVIHFEGAIFSDPKLEPQIGSDGFCMCIECQGRGWK